MGFKTHTLQDIAYRFNIEGLLELDAEAPIFVQVRPVAQTSVIVPPITPPWRLSSSEYTISYVHNSNIKLTIKSYRTHIDMEIWLVSSRGQRGVGDGDDGGDDGGAPRFLQKTKTL